MTKKIGLFITLNFLILSCSASPPNASNTSGDQTSQATSQDEISGESRKNCPRTAYGTCKCDWWRPWSCF